MTDTPTPLVHPGSVDLSAHDAGAPSAEGILFSIHQPMISAAGDIEGRKYHLAQRNGGRRWVVADQLAAADNVYADGGPGSRGMAGRTVTFELVGGGSVEFIGPWKASANSLFEETGHDVRDRYFTQGVVAVSRENGKSWDGPDTYTGILHYDAEAALGTFDRIKGIAQRLANERGSRVVYGVVSKGGGSASYADPEVAQAEAVAK